MSRKSRWAAADEARATDEDQADDTARSRNGGALPKVVWWVLVMLVWVVIVVVVGLRWRPMLGFLVMGNLLVVLAGTLVLRIWHESGKRGTPDGQEAGPATPTSPSVPGRVPQPKVTETPGEMSSLAPLETGPTYELDRTLVPLPVRTVTGASYAASYFGGRVRAQPFEVRGTVLPGLGHLGSGTSGQDVAGAAWLAERQSLLLVVADGLGSKPDSGEVARYAVARLVERAGGTSRQTPLTSVVDEVAKDVATFVRKARAKGATTLLAVELSAVAEGATADIAAVGDCEAWELRQQQWTALSHDRSDHGTHALPHHGGIREDRFLIRTGSVLVLASDGFATALGSGNSRLARELVPRLERPPRPVEFANLVEFRDEFFADDRTALAVWISAAP